MATASGPDRALPLALLLVPPGDSDRGRSNAQRAPRPGECSVMLISVLTTARLRDRSPASPTAPPRSPPPAAPACSPAPHAPAPHRSPPAAGSPARSRPAAAAWVISPTARSAAISSRFRQIAAASSRSPAHPAALGIGDQVGGIGAGQPPRHQLPDEFIDLGSLAGHMLPGPDPVPGRHRAAVDLMPGMEWPPQRSASDNHTGCPLGSGSGARSCTTRDNDGRFPDESPVEVRYPRSKQEEQGDRER